MSTLADLNTAATNVSNAASGLSDSVKAVQAAFAAAKVNSIPQATLDTITSELNTASTALSDAVVALGAIAAGQ